MRKHTIPLVLVVTALLVGSLVLANAVVQAQKPAEVDKVLGIQMSSDSFGVTWDVVGSGGGQIASAHFRVRSTIGQPATGWKQSTSFKEHTGYWQPFTYRVYLPLVVKN